MSAEKKWPFIQWFVTDWLGDPKVSLCEPATRGILFDWLCNMHALDRSGQITGPPDLLARLGRCSPLQVEAALQDLTRTNAADVLRRNGVVTVVNRRMKREHLLRKNGKERVERWRGNADVTPPVTDITQTQQGQNPEPEPEREPQLNQSGRSAAGLTNLTLPACQRVAGEILGNQRGWYYDNCKVKPADFMRKSLSSVLDRYVEKITEKGVHTAWQEAVTRTHQAVTDELVTTTVAGYCVSCWREALDKTVTQGNE